MICGSIPWRLVDQNAANSAVGRAVIAIARELGFKTVNGRRRVELIEEFDGGGRRRADRTTKSEPDWHIARHGQSGDQRRAGRLGIIR